MSSYPQLIFDRFVHRSDVYAEQWFDADRGTGYRKVTQGECPLSPPCPKRQCEHVTTVPIDLETIQKHLNGSITMGVFQLTEDNTVKWACIDVDIAKRAEGDEETLKKNVQSQTLALARVLVTLVGKNNFLVEYSGSRGYHIWIFFSEPVQARYALALLTYSVGKVPPIDGITFEIFPKQTAMRSFGNLVKMPLGIHKKSGTRCPFVNHKFLPFKNQEETLRNVGLLTEEDLTNLIQKYTMEVAPSIRLEPSGNTGKTGKTGLPCMSRMMAEGLSSGVRDLGMFKVGCFLRDRGLPLDLAQAAMTVLNEKNKPPMHEEDVSMKIESAYTVDYSPFPCNDEGLDHYCSSSCRFWDGKVRERWTRFNRKAEDAVGRISRD